MSQLALKGRPWTVFDPGNQEHRAWYYNFVKTGAWGRCPVRFVIPDDHGNLITMIQRKLVEYYVTQEFKQTRRKQC